MLATEFLPPYQFSVPSNGVGMSMRDVAEQLRTRQREWLQRVVDENGIKPTPLAKAIGVAVTTLTRKLNDPDDTAILSDLVVARICQHLKIPTPNFHAKGQPVARPGFMEQEAQPYSAEDDSSAMAMLVKAATERLGVDAWVLKSRALEFIGYFPGDTLIVDLTQTPRANDIVCAQLYDWGHAANTQTIFRIYSPPFLVAAGPDEAMRQPRLVDNQNVMIKGVVITSLRDRQRPTN